MDIEIIENQPINQSRKIPKRNIVLYLSIVAIIMSLTFKFSYAYFNAVVSGNDTAYQTVINSGDLELSFLDTQYINTSNLSIIDANEVATQAEKSTFKVKNTGSATATYRIDLGVTISDNLKSNDFKWELLLDGNTNNSGTFNGVNSGSSITLTSSDLTLAPTAEHSFELRLWLQNDDSRNQIGLTEGTFTGVVSVTASTK